MAMIKVTVREDKFGLKMLGPRGWWNKQAKVSSGELQVDKGISPEI